MMPLVSWSKFNPTLEKANERVLQEPQIKDHPESRIKQTRCPGSFLEA